MNDYYSNQPGPTRGAAIKIVTDKLSRYNKPSWLNERVGELVDEDISMYGGLGSQTGWGISVEPSIWNRLMLLQVRKENNQKLLRKLYYAFVAYGAWLKQYKDIHYKPNGTYMKYTQEKYKTYFR